MINLIVAVDKYFGFSKDNKIPWSIPEDLKIFRRETTDNIIIMGRNTYNSIGRILPKRVNIIISKTLKEVEGGYIFPELLEAINFAKTSYPEKKIYICGGEKIYNTSLELDLIDNIILSYIPIDYKCDLFIEINKFYNYKLKETINYDEFKLFYLSKRKDNKYKFPLPIDNEEFQYLNLLSTVLNTGVYRGSRNSEVISLFSPPKITFDLRKGFPLFTTKRVFWRGIFHELIWFIRGETDSKILEDKGVTIWRKNSTKEFLESRGLGHYDESMIGPMYGFNWRFWGAEYTGLRETNYKGLGYDQLAALIHDLKTDPLSRRLLLTTFDPKRVEESVLCPCHSLPIQFYVSEGRYLDCYQYIRSSDQLLGFPFNCASMSFLLILIAKITGYEPRYCSIQTGDTHIYAPHIEAVKTQLKRFPYEFPTLKIIPDLKTIEDLENLKFEDVIIENYRAHGAIKAEMIA